MIGGFMFAGNEGKEVMITNGYYIFIQYKFG